MGGERKWVRRKGEDVERGEWEGEGRGGGEG